MGYILNIETSTKNCSVALSLDGQLVCCKEIADQGYSHAEKLHQFVEQVIAEANIDLNNLCAIAVSAGPGSYTGLRIGVSTAKGLCYALQIPLLAIDTLTSLAQQVTHTDGIIIPMIDARRMEVYSAIFNPQKEQIRRVQAQILDTNSFDHIDQKIYFIGDSNHKAKEILIHPRFHFLDNITYPSAQQMCTLSYHKFTHQQFEDLAYYEPFYLKDFLLATKK